MKVGQSVAHMIPPRRDAHVKKTPDVDQFVNAAIIYEICARVARRMYEAEQKRA
jgi:hypothetical protein